MAKENDWFLTTLSNVDQNLTTSDFKAAGVNADNSELLGSDVYKNLNSVKNNKLFQTNGKFDDQKFNQFYTYALASYNKLANNTSVDDAMKNATFFRDDILAPAEKRMPDVPEFSFTQVYNPDRVTAGIVNMGKWEEPTMTPMEIAESQPIYDPATGKFTDDTPENSFFKNFFSPVAMASYDEDTVETDPITGERVKHKKGELKINPETGTYYTEFLNGRNSSEKQLIKKTDILTAEGSFMNSLDFFDSDDKHKSWEGTLLKNAIMIAPLIVGGPVTDVAMAISLGLSLTKLGTTLGKMATSSSNATLNNVESFLGTLETGVSQDSQQSAWTAENLINLAGNTFEFLYTMRYIHQNVPAILKGSKIGEADQEAMYKAALQSNVAQKIAQGDSYITPEVMAGAQKEAQIQVENYVKNYQKLGEAISKSYMAATFGAETYNEAKNAGATDTQASLMTLGSIAAQYGLLSSHIGKWIFPEDKFKTMTYDQIINVMRGANELEKTLPVVSDVAKKAKLGWAYKIIGDTKNAIESNYSVVKTGTAGLIQNALSSGVEMTSFDVFHDISGSINNFILELNGDTIAKDKDNVKPGEIVGFRPWENVGTRYLQSFLGGVLGGIGIAPWMPYKQAKEIQNVKSIDDAHRYIIKLIKSGQIDEFVNRLDKLQLGDKNLSTELSRDNTQIFLPASKIEDSQDYKVKQGIKNVVDIYKEALQENGGIVSDSKLLKAQILGDLRFGALLKSKTTKKYTEQLLDLDKEIASDYYTIKSLTDSRLRRDTNGPTDEQERNDPEVEDTIKQCRDRIKENVAKKNDLLAGKSKFLSEAIFEMCTDISEGFGLPNLLSYTKEKLDKNYQDLSDSEKVDIEEQYKNYVSNNFLQDLEKRHALFIEVAKKTKKLVEQIQADNDKSDAILESYKTEVQKLSGLYSIKDPTVATRFAESTQKYALFNILRPYYSKEDLQKYEDVFGKYDNSKERKDRLFNDIIKHFEGNDIFQKESFEGTKFVSWVLNKCKVSKEFNDLVNQIVKESILGSGFETDPRDWQELLKDEHISNEDKEKAVQKLRDNDVIGYNMQMDLIPVYAESFLNSYLSDAIKDLSSSRSSSILVKDLLTSVDKLGFEVIQDYNYQSNQKKSIFNKDADILNILVKNGENFYVENAFQEFLNSIQGVGNRLDVKEILSKFEDIPNIPNIDPKYLAELDLLSGALKTFKGTLIAADREAIGMTNPFGHNVIYNEHVKDELPVVEHSTVQEINNQLDFIQGRVTYLKKIAESKILQKMTIQSSIATNLEYVRYEEYGNLVKQLKDLNWEGADDLISLYNGLSELSKQCSSDQRNLYLSDEEYKKIFQERLKFENALHDVIVNNKDHFGTLLEKYNLFQKGEQVVDEKLKKESDSAFVWHLATIGALRPDNFYALLKSHIPEGIAPLSPQIDQIYMMVAYSCDTDKIFESIIEQYNKALLDAVDTHPNLIPDGYKKKKNPDEIKKSIKNSFYYIQYDRLLFSEGVPGSGKSSVVIKTVTDILRSLDGDIFKKVAVVNTEDETATKLANSLGISAKTFSHTDFVESILKDYRRKDRIEELLTPNSESPQLNVELDKTDDPYKVIIIDEATNISDLEYMKINEYAKQHNTLVFLCGDTEQSGYNINYTFEGIDFETNLHSGNFIHGSKLGAQIRTSNEYSTYNNVIFREFQNSENYNNSDRLTFKYYTSASRGLQGNKVISKDEQTSDDTIKVIDNMVACLKGEEKITFIFNDPNTELYKKLDSSPYKDHIKFVKGSAQGQEGRFYIYEDYRETVKNEDIDNYVKDLRTSTSRASEGTLILINKAALGTYIESQESHIPLIEQKNTTEINTFRNRMLNIINGIAIDKKEKISLRYSSGNTSQSDKEKNKDNNEDDNEDEGTGTNEDKDGDTGTNDTTDTDDTDTGNPRVTIQPVNTGTTDTADKDKDAADTGSSTTTNGTVNDSLNDDTDDATASEETNKRISDSNTSKINLNVIPRTKGVIQNIVSGSENGEEPINVQILNSLKRLKGREILESIVYTDVCAESGIKLIKNKYGDYNYFINLKEIKDRYDGVYGLIRLFPKEFGNCYDEKTGEIKSSKYEEIIKRLEMIKKIIRNSSSNYELLQTLEKKYAPNKMKFRGFFGYINTFRFESKDASGKLNYQIGNRDEDEGFPIEGSRELGKSYGKKLCYFLTNNEGKFLLSVPLIKLPNPLSVITQFESWKEKGEKGEYIKEGGLKELTKGISDDDNDADKLIEQVARKDGETDDTLVIERLIKSAKSLGFFTVVKQLHTLYNKQNDILQENNININEIYDGNHKNIKDIYDKYKHAADLKLTQLKECCLEQCEYMKGLLTLAKLIEVYQYHGNSLFVLDKNFTFSKHFASKGPLSIEKPKQRSYFINRYETRYPVGIVLSGQTSFGYNHTCTCDKSYSDILVETADGGVAKKGYPFVLIGPAGCDTEELISIYKEEVSKGNDQPKTVYRYYVNRPTESGDYYIKYLIGLLNKNSNSEEFKDYIKYANYNLGNDLTPLDMLFKLNEKGVLNDVLDIYEPEEWKIEELQEYLTKYKDKIKDSKGRKEILQDLQKDDHKLSRRLKLILYQVATANKLATFITSTPPDPPLQKVLDALKDMKVYYSGERLDKDWGSIKEINGSFYSAENVYKFYTLNQVVQGPLYTGDIGIVLDQILDGMIPQKNHKIYSSYDFSYYYRGKIDYNNLQRLKKISHYDTTDTELQKIFDKYSEKELKEALYKSLYIPISYNGSSYIFSPKQSLAENYRSYKIESIDVNEQGQVVIHLIGRGMSELPKVTLSGTIHEEEGKERKIILSLYRQEDLKETKPTDDSIESIEKSKKEFTDAIADDKEKEIFEELLVDLTSCSIEDCEQALSEIEKGSGDYPNYKDSFEKTEKLINRVLDLKKAENKKNRVEDCHPTYTIEINI